MRRPAAWPGAFKAAQEKPDTTAAQSAGFTSSALPTCIPRVPNPTFPRGRRPAGTASAARGRTDNPPKNTNPPSEHIARCSAGDFCFLLIICVEEHRLDGYHLVIFLLRHLHVGIQRLEVVLDDSERLLCRDRAAVQNDALHTAQHDRMRVARRKRKVQVVRQVRLHFLLRLRIVFHDGGAVVACGREHAEAGEGENRGKAEQRKVNRERIMLREGEDAESERGEAEHGNRHRRPTVAAVRALIIAAALCRHAQALGQLGALT